MNYDTQSIASKLFMIIIDLLFHKFKRKKKNEINGKIVISSISGLGDLWIQLPLIDALVNKFKNENHSIQVALQPQHIEVAKIMGWPYLEFKNPATIYFKEGKAKFFNELKLNTFKSNAKKADWWIDLTGNAMNAIYLKLFFTKNLASPASRGGKGLIDLILPHYKGENEYNNKKRLADFFGLSYNKNLLREHFNLKNTKEAKITIKTVSMVISTPCKWRNWPLKNYLTIIKKFPDIQFSILGFTSEICSSDIGILDQISLQKNVTSRLDSTSIIDLINTLLETNFLISPDTSTAHLANLLRCHGAVLFGPTPDQVWTFCESKLALIHKVNCKLFPCVQWKCKNPHHWCMNQIVPDDIIPLIKNCEIPVSQKNLRIIK